MINLLGHLRCSPFTRDCERAGRDPDAVSYPQRAIASQLVESYFAPSEEPQGWYIQEGNVLDPGVLTAVSSQSIWGPCGPPSGRASSALKQAVADVIDFVATPPSQELCVMEVGTADGTGTTVALYEALREHCLLTGQRYRIASYEGVPALALTAQGVWDGYDHVHVLNELALVEDVLQVRLCVCVRARVQNTLSALTRALFGDAAM